VVRSSCCLQSAQCVRLVIEERAKEEGLVFSPGDFAVPIERDASLEAW
jgi:hypothetical protein